MSGHGSGNSHNGKRTKTVLTDNAGEVTIRVPGDRDGSFTPVIVPKRAKRLNDVDAVSWSLYAKGLTTGEISAHFGEATAEVVRLLSGADQLLVMPVTACRCALPGLLAPHPPRLS